MWRWILDQSIAWFDLISDCGMRISWCNVLNECEDAWRTLNSDEYCHIVVYTLSTLEIVFIVSGG